MVGVRCAEWLSMPTKTSPSIPADSRSAATLRISSAQNNSSAHAFGWNATRTLFKFPYRAFSTGQGSLDLGPRLPLKMIVGLTGCAPGSAQIQSCSVACLYSNPDVFGPAIRQLLAPLGFNVRLWSLANGNGTWSTCNILEGENRPYFKSSWGMDFWSTRWRYR